MRTITIEQSVKTAVTPSPRVLETASMFGLGVDETRTVQIVPRLTIPLPPSSCIFITGPSGGGKSTTIRLIRGACAADGMLTLAADQLPETPDLPLVDCFGERADLAHVTALLTCAGLGDAFVMLRSPRELSDGQRARFALARLIDHADRVQESAIITADEFGATLDRLTAKNLARSVSRWIRRTPHTFIAATTHDDLLEPLAPAVLIYKGLGAEAEVITR